MQPCVSGGAPSDTCSLPASGFTDSTSELLRSLHKCLGCEHAAHLWPAQSTSLPTPRCPCHSARLSDDSAAADLALTSVPPSYPPLYTLSAPSPPPISRESSGSLRGQGLRAGRGSRPRRPAGHPFARPPSPPPARAAGGHPTAAPALGRGAEPARHRPFPLPAPGGP